MTKLYDLVEVMENNEACVILKVKPAKDLFIKLICLGCFEGDEMMFRLTKGKNHTCTVFRREGKPYSWEWGMSGHTLVCKAMQERGRMIERCIRDDFGIPIE